MSDPILLVLALAGAALALATGYQTILMLASLPWLLRRKTLEPAPARTRFMIVIPAHDEAALIGQTVASILTSPYPADLRSVVVVADNCTDDTAAIARRAGASCWERRDLERRGKPHALHWIFERVDLGAVDAVVIVDGDTVVDRDFLGAMDRRLQAGEEAIQGFYGVMNPDETWLTRLAMLPAALKFYLTFPGKQALGLSCPLAGNGMCFKADIIRKLGWNAFTLSEDWEYYLILALNGYVVSSAPEAIIYGQVARSLELGRAQRMRWMKGRVDALALHWRPLIRKALRDRSPVPIDALLDIARPTHSMLLSWTVIYLVLCTALWAADDRAWTLVVSALTILAAQVTYFLAGFAVGRPPLRTWLALAMVPWYLVWKFGVTMKALLTLRERRWIKTTRN